MSSKQKNKQLPSRIRIIGGKWRSRKLVVANEDGLRPTGDRVRETLFNWLAPDTAGSRCLDAFAGTGALGLEALSRGARWVDFIEIEPRSTKRLEENLNLLDCRDASTYCTNFTQWQLPGKQQPYNIVFLDPPFAQNLWEDAIEHLIHANLLAKDALVYIESPVNTSISSPEAWKVIKQKSLGQIKAELYETTPTIQDRISQKC